MDVILPHVFAVRDRAARNPILQISQRAQRKSGNLAVYSRASLRAHLFQPDDGSPEVLIVSRRHALAKTYPMVVVGIVEPGDVVDLSRGEWLNHPAKTAGAMSNEHVLASWRGAFSYIEEDPGTGQLGLRRPQLGALHAIQAHWAISEAPATIVMPTGTGKTETMLAVLVTEPCAKADARAGTPGRRAW
jgi:hypothetical protein